MPSGGLVIGGSAHRKGRCAHEDRRTPSRAMLYVLPNPGRRFDLLTRAARAVGYRTLREDPHRISRLLEQTIGRHDRWFAPTGAPDALSLEEVRIHGGRLEDLIDEAVMLAVELYPGKARDAVLLTIANNAERLMRRIWTDPWAAGAQLINTVEANPIHERLRSLELVRRAFGDRDG